MDARFTPARRALEVGDLATLTALLDADPTLASDPSLAAGDHPNLLQCLVLTSPWPDELEAMIALFAERGANLEGSLVAASGIGNLRAMRTLLDHGAAVDGKGEWTPIEEALYWNQAEAVDLLLERGSTARNLRIAAALGELGAVRKYFVDPTGLALAPGAGRVAWPFDRTKLPAEVVADPAAIVGNAFVHAASWGRTEVVREFLVRGVDVNLIPAGFDFAGTALHYAAFHGNRDLVDDLLAKGADPAVRDAKLSVFPEDWAEHEGHDELATYLKTIREGRA